MERKSRGDFSAHRLFSLKEMGFSNVEPHVQVAIEAFLGIGEAVARRWIQMPKGVLLLQMVPGNKASGAIYLYDRMLQEFYFLSFEGPDDTLTVEEFGELLAEYDLLQYAEQPGRLRSRSQTIASA